MHQQNLTRVEEQTAPKPLSPFTTMRVAFHGARTLRRSLRPDLISPTTRNPILRMSTADSAPAAPWYAAYPAPKSEVVTISRDEVLGMLKATPVDKRDFVLVDLRRNDFEVS